MAFAKKFVLHLGNFVAQYHFYLVALITSSFLTQFVGVEYVGYVFIGSSILVALILYAAPPIFRSFGTRNVLTVIGIAELTVLLTLAMTTNWVLAVSMVTLQMVLSYSLFIGLDLLIESTIEAESTTGSKRTLYLILTNVAVLVGSLSLSVLVIGDQYWRVFVMAAMVMIPFIAISVWLFPSVSFPSRESEDGSVIRAFKGSPSVRRIALAHLLLQVCFAWFSIYIPILLFSYELFSWYYIGIIMAIAMLPYIILEYPLGFIADKWLGEKEFLTIGFAILGLALIAMWLLHDTSFWWWVGIMLFSRVGAAMVEAMTEVHFFRHVTERDTAVITSFRVLRPLGSVIGPLVASVALMFLSLPTTFIVFGLVMFLGIPLSLSIADSK